MKKVLRRVLYPMAAAYMAAALFGCSKSDGDVTNPNPNEFKPKGTIQGHLLDSVTQAPIVGAVVDIGVAQATTSATGEFVLRDVPATYDASNDNTAYGTYEVTIDLRAVTSPIDMKTATVKYPDFAYEHADVQYSRFDDTGPTSSGSNYDGSTDVTATANSSNHATPVDFLAQGFDFQVGKLAATIKGMVVSQSTGLPLSTGYVVKLQSDDSNNSTTGADRHVIATATPAADGTFTFANVEVFQSFDLYVYQNDQKAGDRVDVRTPSDGQTVVAANLVVLDDRMPTLVSTSPEWGQDLAPSDTQTVVFTFSEPIKATAYATATTAATAAINGIYNDVSVTWDDTKVQLPAKVSNVQYTLAWNAEMTQLTVTLKTGVSALYTVTLATHQVDGVWFAGSSDNYLFDLTDNKVTVDPDRLPHLGEVRFSTSGGLLAAAPTGLVVTNASSIDWTGHAEFDWAPAAGAKTYNLYCTAEQLWGTESNTHQFLLMNDAPIIASQASLDNEDFELVENDQIALKGLCYVVGVNSDGLEGPASATVEIKDVVAPQLSSVSPEDGLSLPDAGKSEVQTLTVYFNEPMNEATVTDPANYAFVGDPVTDVAGVAEAPILYDATDWSVTLPVRMTNPDPTGTFSGNWTLTVSNVTDVAGNVIDPKHNTYVETVEPPLPTLPVTLLNGTKQGYQVEVKADDGTTDFFNTILLWNATGGEFVLPTTPYALPPNGAAPSVPRLSWDTYGPNGDATFTVYRFHKVLNGVDELDLTDPDYACNRLHGTTFVDDGSASCGIDSFGNPFSSTQFDEFGIWSAIQHFPVEFYYVVEAHLADSSVPTGPGTFEVLARSAVIPVNDQNGPYINAVNASALPVGLPPADGLTYRYDVIVTFNEPMRLSGIENPANYRFTPAGAAVDTDLPMNVTAAALSADHSQATLTVTLSNPVAGGKTLLTNWVLTVSGVSDVAGNAISSQGDQWANNLGALLVTTPGVRTTGSPAAIDPAGLFNPF